MLSRIIVCLVGILAYLGFSDAGSSWSAGDGVFLLNYEPFRVISAEVHYWRILEPLWEDRILRLKSMGYNTLQVYVNWQWHETSQGFYDFSSPGRNISNFFALAAQNDMLIALRPGPYICAEVDFGGFPPYLFNIPDMVIRTNNSAYLDRVTSWYQQLLPIVSEYLIENDENTDPTRLVSTASIVSISIENEFASYGDTQSNPGDAAYIQYLVNLVKSLCGDNVLLTSTDGGSTSYFARSAITPMGQILQCGDGGPSTDNSGLMLAEKTYNPPNHWAYIVTETYLMWISTFGNKWSNGTAIARAASYTSLFSQNGSVSVYMGYGGTNWGWTAGADGGGASISAVTQSYDYGASVSEAGCHGWATDGDTFLALKQVFGYWNGVEPIPELPCPPTTAFGPVVMTSGATLLDNLAVLAIPQVNPGLTLSMENLGTFFGFMLYNTTFQPSSANGNYSLTIGTVRDRAEVFVAGQSVGTTYRNDVNVGKYSFSSSLIPNSASASVAILNENLGHINFGHGMDIGVNQKGVWTVNISDASGASVPLDQNWTAWGTDLNYSLVSQLPFAPVSAPLAGPAFYQGSFTTTNPTDTYVALCGWQKGNIWINGFHLGRYWPAFGPQFTLYIPAQLLFVGQNTITVFEQHAAAANMTVMLVDEPDFSGAVCGVAEEFSQMHPSVGRGGKTAPVPESTQNHSPVARAGPSAEQEGACTPQLGASITQQPCNTASALQWTITPVGPAFANAGIIQASQLQNLCIIVNGTNADTSTPAMTLGQCDPSDINQHFIYFSNLTTRPIMNLAAVPGAGSCIDIPGSATAPGTQLDLWGCDGGLNQNWSFNNSQLVSASSNLCLAAC